MAQQLDPRSEEIARGHRARLVQLEVPYLRAKEYLKSDQFSLDQIATLAKIRSVMRAGLKEQGEALFILGRVEQILVDTYQFQEVITEYESTQQTLAKMYPDK